MSASIIHLHYLSTFALVGLIWTIQCVHYPSFKYVAVDKFVAFHNFHTKSITAVVAPLMLIEVFAALYIWVKLPSSFSLINLGSVLLVWILTAALSIPLHHKLSIGYDLATINKLVLTNWGRTIIWTLRAACFVYLLSYDKAPFKELAAQ